MKSINLTVTLFRVMSDAEIDEESRRFAASFWAEYEAEYWRRRTRQDRIRLAHLLAEDA